MVAHPAGNPLPESLAPLHGLLARQVRVPVRVADQEVAMSLEGVDDGPLDAGSLEPVAMPHRLELYQARPFVRMRPAVRDDGAQDLGVLALRVDHENLATRKVQRSCQSAVAPDVQRRLAEAWRHPVRFDEVLVITVQLGMVATDGRHVAQAHQIPSELLSPRKRHLRRKLIACLQRQRINVGTVLVDLSDGCLHEPNPGQLGRLRLMLLDEVLNWFDGHSTKTSGPRLAGGLRQPVDSIGPLVPSPS
mmetsp:Transcript_40608/g.130666  ORF Transcript_40608/g.130666 Transcript_40608/m.130666 type:complete len:248 (-) Transcript_40608:233-976(-)